MGYFFAGVAACIVLLPVLFLALGGCAPKPLPPPKVADLHFPVLVLYPGSLTVLFKDAADLGVMHTNVVVMLNEPPVLIDSEFNICTMEKLRSTHNGLWLMAHPAGNTEVEFVLSRAPKSGLEAARAAMQAQLDKQTWRSDLGKKRAALATQATLEGMLKVLRDDDTEK